MSIYNVISDLENTRKLSLSLRNRKLDQSLLYQWKWANMYYSSIEGDELFKKWNKDILGIKDFYNFGSKNIFSKEEWISLISLGCWKSYIESYMFKKLWKDYPLIYLGIDSSKEMLDLSEKEIKDIGVDYTLVCSDFSEYWFNDIIKDFSSRWKKRIYCFLSNTFWNINHTNIIDILYNVLNKWEQIWLDVRLRKNKTVSGDLDIFNIHKLNDNNTDMEKFFSQVLEGANISNENGYFSKKMENKEWINALKIDFDFIFTKKTVIDIKWQITFLPEEHLRCLQIYYYDSESLINFFAEHGFKLVDKQEKYMRWQFLFEKE